MIQKLVAFQVKFPKNPVEDFGFKVGLKIATLVMSKLLLKMAHLVR